MLFKLNETYAHYMTSWDWTSIDEIHMNDTQINDSVATFSNSEETNNHYT